MSDAQMQATPPGAWHPGTAVTPRPTAHAVPALRPGCGVAVAAMNPNIESRNAFARYRNAVGHLCFRARFFPYPASHGSSER
jgi:hypothetical protein